MGWSYSWKAGEVLEGWEERCRASTGSSNAWLEDGREWFYETRRKEHADGSITGTIMVSTTPGRCRVVDRFKISGAGVVVRAPAFLKGKG